ncbi:MAG: ABC transporter permease [Bryobacterales bacterium]|nr:ABC transporter permease [Bryobacterales bacterium]
MKYVATRCLHAIAMVAAVAAIGFVLLDATPGDFLTDLQANPAIPAATVQRMRADYALDDPLPTRFWHWFVAAYRGDWGYSLGANRPVAELLLPRASRTLLLAVAGLGAAWLIGVPLGVLGAADTAGWMRPVSGAVALLTAWPDLLISLAILHLAVRTGWITVSGSLPGAALALALISLPAVYRHTVSAVRTVLGAPFIASARAHGLPEWRIWTVHILPAAAHPLIGLLGLSLASLLSASLLVEVVLGWPGMGPLLLEAIAARDHHVVLASVVWSACFASAGNLLADLLLLAADPRIRRTTRP